MLRFLTALAAATSAGSLLASPQETHILMGNEVTPQHTFGLNNGIDGDLIVVRSDEGVEASLYVFNATTGAQIQRIPSPPPFGHHFGWGVAISGSSVLVSDWSYGAPGHGRAWIYDAFGGQMQQVLVPDDAPTHNQYGYSVALSGTRALVSGNAGINSAAYLFDVGTGDQLLELRPPVPSDTDRFGYAVGLDDSHAVVTTLDDVVYVYDATTGAQVALLHAPSPFGSFGRDVDVDGGVVLVGATNVAESTGAAYLFEASTGILLHELQATDGAPDDFFGSDVSLDLPYATVSATSHQGGGAVFVFDVTTGQQIAKLVGSTGATGDALGVGVSLSGTTIVAGAPCHDGPGSSFVFEVPTYGTSPFCSGIGCPCGNEGAGISGCTNASGSGATLTGTGSTSVSGDDLVLGVTGATGGQFGIVFMGVGQGTTSFGNGKLCVAPGATSICRFPVMPVDLFGGSSFGPGIVATSQALSPSDCHIDAGETWNFQFWYRDPGGPCGGGFNLSNAVSATFAP